MANSGCCTNASTSSAPQSLTPTPQSSPQPPPTPTPTPRGVGVTIICPGPISTGSPDSPRLIFGSTGLIPQPHTGSKGKMAPERCAALIANAMAHGVNEAWIAKHPVLLMGGCLGLGVGWGGVREGICSVRPLHHLGFAGGLLTRFLLKSDGE